MLSELDVDKVELLAQVRLIAEKIRLAVAEPYTLEIQQNDTAASTTNHCCTASIGVVVFTNQLTSPEDILKRADIAMYKAKREGGNSLRFYE